MDTRYEKGVKEFGEKLLKKLEEKEKITEQTVCCCERDIKQMKKHPGLNKEAIERTERILASWATQRACMKYIIEAVTSALEDFS